MNARTFAVATSVDDPLIADRLVALLEEEGIEAMSRPGGAATTAAFASTSGTFFDLLVDSAHLERARAVVSAELTALEAQKDENAKAAEEEALGGRG